MDDPSPAGSFFFSYCGELGFWVDPLPLLGVWVSVEDFLPFLWCFLCFLPELVSDWGMLLLWLLAEDD